MQLDHERLDVYEIALDFLVLLDEAVHKTAQAMLVRIVSMLVKLAQSCEG